MTTQPSREWLVIIPDLPDSAIHRPKLGEQHVADMLPDRGTLWLLGGMLVDETVTDRRRVTGNVIIAKAASKEEVLEQLKKDVYASDGVWDMKKVQIMAFESLFRKGLGFDM